MGRLLPPPVLAEADLPERSLRGLRCARQMAHGWLGSACAGR